MSNTMSDMFGIECLFGLCGCLVLIGRLPYPIAVALSGRFFVLFCDNAPNGAAAIE